jgi:hypothetical protein
MTNVKTYTLSLSRWHAVAGRLRTHAEALFERAQAVIGNTSVVHEVSSAQISALQERGANALAELGIARAAMQGATVIRAKLASANAAEGVTALLAEAEGLRREVQQLARIEAIDPLRQVELSQVNGALSRNAESGNGRHLYGNQGVPVAMVGLNALEGFARDKLVLERRQVELMDQVNDLNRKTLQIELPVAVAQAAGL